MTLFADAMPGYAGGMKAEWSYEHPPAGAGTEGLEGYAAFTAQGEPAGKVVTLLRQAG